MTRCSELFFSLHHTVCSNVLTPLCPSVPNFTPLCPFVSDTAPLCLFAHFPLSSVNPTRYIGPTKCSVCCKAHGLYCSFGFDRRDFLQLEFVLQLLDECEYLFVWQMVSGNRQSCWIEKAVCSTRTEVWSVQVCAALLLYLEK